MQNETQMCELSKQVADIESPKMIFDNVPIINGIAYKDNCGAGRSLLSIDADGSVYPCHFMMQPTLKIGNMVETPIEEILLAGKRHSDAMNVDNINECNECDYKYLCGGGCRAHVYKGENEIRKSDDCEFYKGYYDKIIDGIR